MKFYTTQEVADILKITPSSVIKLIKRRNLKAKKIARKWRISKKHLEEFMETDLNE